MNEPTRVFIHADESCLGNQFKERANPGGAAGLVETWTDGGWVRRDYWISEPDTTNNRMAIRSAIEALGALKRRCDVTFVSDSQYLVKGMSEWVRGWKARGWKRKTGVIENLELRVIGKNLLDRRYREAADETAALAMGRSYMVGIVGRY